MKWFRNLAYGLILVGQAPLHAEIVMNGFMNVGVRYSSDKKGFYGEDHAAPNFRSLSKFGLNINGGISDNLYAAAQLVARLVDGDALTYLNADWAFFNYTLFDKFSIRAGRIKLPMFLASEYIDVGREYVWTSEPSLYDGYPLKSVDGMSLTYQDYFGDYDFTFDIWAGDITKLFTLAQGDVPLVGEKLHGGRLVLGHENFSVRIAQNTATWQAPAIGIKDRKAAFSTAGLTASFGMFGAIAEYSSVEVVNKDDLNEEADALEAQLAAVQTQIVAATQAGQDTTALITTAKQIGGAAAARRAGQGPMNSYALTLTAQVTEDALVYLFHDDMDKGGKKPFLDIDKVSNAIGVKYDLAATADVTLQVRQHEIKGETFGLANFWYTNGVSPASPFEGSGVSKKSMDYQLIYNLVF